MRTLESLLAIALATACGNVTAVTSSDPPPDASPDSAPASDASPDAPAVATTITLNVVGTPALLAYRDGLTGPWQLPEPTGPNTYSMSVHGPYIVTTVCERAGRSSVLQRARTLEDPHEITFSSFRCSPIETTVTVGGHMVQPGTVALAGGQTSSSDVNGFDFQLVTNPGLQDLVVATKDRVAIRRNLDIQQNTTMPTIDMNVEGHALVPVTFSVSNVTSEEQLSALVNLTSSTTNLLGLYVGGLSALVSPSSLLSNSTTQSVEIDARTKNTFRATTRDSFRVGDPVAFVMPPLVQGVHFMTTPLEISAQWTPIPDADEVVFGVFGGGIGGTPVANMSMIQSRSFLAATGRSFATIDLDIPGFQTRWQTDLNGSVQRSVIGLGTTPAGSTYSSYDEMSPGTAQQSLVADQRRRGPRGLRVEP